MVSTDEILRKYQGKIESELNSSSGAKSSIEYKQFKEDMKPTVTRYEKLALSLGNLVKINIAEKDRIKLQKELDIAQTSINASQAVTLSLFSLLFIFILTLMFSVAIYIITGTAPILFGILGVLISFFAFHYTYSMPRRLANQWRLQASSQMVPAILYLVVYMKHTSNLERAIEFTSQHLEAPLANDFKKMLYDVEVGKYSTVKQSLDIYLEKWRDYAPEFIESFHLIESSLYEPSESRRVAILEKSLQVILDGVYEKMLKYSRSIRSPLTNVYMLGIILPTLGLALLPLASSLLQGIIKASHVFLLFNILVPFLVFYMASEVLLRRPGGYGETSLLEKNPEYASYISKAPWVLASVIAIPLLLFGLLPFILQVEFIQDSLNFAGDSTAFFNTPLFDFKNVGGKLIGPFSPIAVLFSLFIPLGVGLFFATSYKQKTKRLIIAREQTKKLEEEFTNSLFQLGNRLGDGVPAEIAFAKVAESTQGQLTHDFFSLVNKNIQQSGMSVERAVFDPKQGAIIYYPSSLISTAMRILVESVKKGLQVAARSLMSISDYVKNIDKINQRLKDLLAEIVSDMKSNMVFLAPLLAGIVVGLSVMITSILTKLQGYQTDIGSVAGGTSALGSLSSITSLFNVTEMISPYFLQISIGLYIIEIIFILTTALVTIDAGKDPLREKYEIAQNIKRGLFLYLATAALSTVVLTALSSIALGSL